VLETVTHAIVRFMDLLLGWLLRLPSDVQIFTVAIGSALVLTAVRVWTTDQDLLRCCAADKRRLKSLIREAKSRADRAAIQRHRATLGMISMKQLRQEGRPLLASLLPIVLLAMWAVHRLEFHPVKAGERFEFVAAFPVSAVGKIAHLVPLEGVAAASGWVQEVRAVPAGAGASWWLSAQASDEPYRLRLRFEKTTIQHLVRAGTGIYEAPRTTHDECGITTELRLREVRLFGFVPGFSAIGFPAWLVGYLAIVIPCTLLGKKALRIL